MARIADLIGRVLRAPSDDAVIDEVRGEVRTLCEKFPVY
jgi:glycine/serine hydroxymethyltransferase